jgi:hypothetical protein
MKRTSLFLSVILFGALAITGCNKQYHCHCTYNNEIRFSKDLGVMSESDAQRECSSFDTTVRGEVWNCSLY